MHKIFCSSLWLALLLAGCGADKNSGAATAAYRVDSLDLFDTARNRRVPVALYLPGGGVAGPHKIVILSHGYGANKGGDNRSYSYLCGHLAAQGYWVASIQHELPTDSLMPLSGVPQVVRRPFWERGAANILFVLRSLQKTFPALDYAHLALIGHSNGGDMSALFVQQYPALADKLITLDNRRMALPRIRQPRIYSLRSSDQPADAGVLPTPAEQRQYGITIIPLPRTIHNDMDDSGTTRQRREITDYILRFLEE